ncbi:MAG: M3 family metallopeptidase [Bacteriovoracaceae bacterium]|nr:M3 family metallopeptidase [Bacteriovoracaceae bacterium]
MFTFENISTLDHQATPFHDLKNYSYVNALKNLIKQSQVFLEKFLQEDKQSPKNTFEEIILPFEKIQDSIGYLSNIFYSLYSAEGTEEIRSQSEEFSSLVTDFSSKFNMHPQLFEILKRLKSKVDKNETSINREQQTVLEKYYSTFVRNGSLLNDVDKLKLEKIDQDISQLQLKFSENLLKSTKSVKILLTDKSEVQGIPESILELMEAAAKKMSQTGWAATLDGPIYIPIMQHAHNRSLREKLAKAYLSRATSEEFNNRPIVKNILLLRMQRAQLLGYRSHADYILEKRMAKDKHTVIDFTEKLFTQSLPFAKEEFERLKNKAKSEGVDLQKWDTAYYSEKVKSELLNFNDESLRPYFPLPAVLEGLWVVASKLFSLKFKERKDLPTYHPQVQVYEVFHEKSHKFIGLMYTDFYTRDSKRAGAWMGSFLEQGKQFDQMTRPHVSIVCNFAPHSDSRPSLLSFQDVRTLYHEFGHALHGLLTDCTYRIVSGTNVYWDFVELPSQLMENWLLEKECLDLFAAHYQTKEKIPQELLGKLKAYQQFQAGLAMMRQLSFGYLDMMYHSIESEKSIPEDLSAFEKQHLSKFSFMSPLDGECLGASFGHLFSDGGYAAGYYSYKWAEVLEADCFEEFKKQGIFHAPTAQKYVDCILSQGGKFLPIELFQKFMGRAPDTNSLLRRSGLIKSV